MPAHLDGRRKRAHSGDAEWRWKAGKGGNRARRIDAPENAAVGLGRRKESKGVRLWGKSGLNKD